MLDYFRHKERYPDEHHSVFTRNGIAVSMAVHMLPEVFETLCARLDADEDRPFLCEITGFFKSIGNRRVLDPLVRLFETVMAGWPSDPDAPAEDIALLELICVTLDSMDDPRADKLIAMLPEDSQSECSTQIRVDRKIAEYRRRPGKPLEDRIRLWIPKFNIAGRFNWKEFKPRIDIEVDHSSDSITREDYYWGLVSLGWFGKWFTVIIKISKERWLKWKVYEDY